MPNKIYVKYRGYYPNITRHNNFVIIMQKDLNNKIPSTYISLHISHKIIFLANYIVKRVILNILIAQDMTVYSCHNVLTVNDSFYDTYNVKGLEMKFQAHFTESKERLSTFWYL